MIFFPRYCRSVECRSIGADPHFPKLPRPPKLSAPVSVDTTSLLIILFIFVIIFVIFIKIFMFIFIIFTPSHTLSTRLSGHHKTLLYRWQKIMTATCFSSNFVLSLNFGAYIRSAVEHL